MTNANPNDAGPDGGRDNAPSADALGRDVGRTRQSHMGTWMGNSAADMLGPQLVLATQDQGYTAALNGDHVDTCPWRAANTDRERALRQMWIRGYSAGRTDLRSARDPNRPTQ